MKVKNILLTFAFLLAVEATVAQQTKQPNILWLTSEDNSASWIGCYGNEYAKTPNIDGLAEEGFQYMNAYANAPVCAAQRSTWITGIMSLSMGTHNMRSFYNIPHDSIKFYPDLLSNTGYYTANYQKMDYNIGGRDHKECWDDSDPVNWEELKNNQPFFQVVNLNSSHESTAFGDVENTKHNPSETNLAKYHPDVPDIRKNYAKYYDAINQMDNEVGVNLKKLKELGLDENTIVIYVSDHGGVLPRSKRFLFVNSLHCPLIIRIPEKYKKLWPAEEIGTQIERLVSFIDMPKTWLSITGSEIPEIMQGSIFLGENSEKEPEYNFAFRGRMDERIDNARAVNDKRFIYIRNYMPYTPWMQHLEYLWNIKATQVWESEVKAGNTNELQSRFFAPKGWTEELYDIQNDYDCIVNLADNPKYKEVVKRMRIQLRKQQIEKVDAGLLPEAEMKVQTEKYKTTAYELARNPKLYNVSKILDVADLALEKNPKNLKKLQKMLHNESVAIRYWTMIGGFLLNNKEMGLAGINDESHEIKAMAAWTLINSGEKEKGIHCLNKLISERSYALLTIFNIAEWMGNSGKELMAAINKVDLTEKYKNQHKYPIRMRKHLNEIYK